MNWLSRVRGMGMFLGGNKQPVVAGSRTALTSVLSSIAGRKIQIELVPP